MQSALSFALTQQAHSLQSCRVQLLLTTNLSIHLDRDRIRTSVTTFTSWLLSQERSGKVTNELALVLVGIAAASKRIASLVARAPIEGAPRPGVATASVSCRNGLTRPAVLSGMVGLAGESNASGDEQKARATSCQWVAVSGCALTRMTAAC